MTDYVKTLNIADSDRVLIKNRELVNWKIQKLVKGGYNGLQIISDFDKTITKQHVNGQRKTQVFDLFNSCRSVPPETKKCSTELFDKYVCFERDPTITEDERAAYMTTLWTKNIEIYKGLNISQEDIDAVCKDMPLPVRDYTKEFFDKLTKENVPVLLISAGIGDVLESILKHAGVTGSNIEIVTNYLKRDHEGRIEGYRGPIVQTTNKNNCDITYTKFYKSVANRPNAILLGDNLGDANMANRLKNIDNIIKIGFFYAENAVVLPSWKDAFDIVLIDDQTMNVPRNIIKLLEDQ